MKIKKHLEQLLTQIEYRTWAALDGDIKNTYSNQPGNLVINISSIISICRSLLSYYFLLTPSLSLLQGGDYDIWFCRGVRHFVQSTWNKRINKTDSLL